MFAQYASSIDEICNAFDRYRYVNLFQVFDQKQNYGGTQSKIGSKDNAGHVAGGGQDKVSLISYKLLEKTRIPYNLFC